MDPMGYKPGFLNVFMALMIGYFANLALPRLGEITRCTVLAKYEKIPFQKGLGTVVAERAFDVLTFLVLFFINLIVQYTLLYEYVNEKIFIPLAEKAGILGQAWFLYGAIAFLVIVVVVLYVMRRKLERFSLWRKLTGILSGFGDGLKSLLKLKRPFLFLLYTVLMWFMYFLMTWICFYSLAGMGGLGMQAAFSVLVLGTIGIMLVQGGVGIYPAIVAETLFLYGAASTTAYALGWLIWSAQTFALILAGIVSLILLPIINKSKNGQNGHPEKEDPVAA